jgi:LPS-assembly protein
MSAMSLACALLLTGNPAHAQDAEAMPQGSADQGPLHPSTREAGHAPTPAAANAAPTAPDAVPVAFEADKVEYDQNADVVTATGNVVLRREGKSARADKVVWNRKTGEVVATGNVRSVDENGNQLYTDRAELTQELKAGAMGAMLLALREGGRIAAASGKRDDKGNVTLADASYSACRVDDEQGCPRNPTWRVTAKRVSYNPDQKLVAFSGARLELFHTVAVPMLPFKLNTEGHPTSGVLIPAFQSTPSNGFQIDGSYYWHISDTRDLTGTLSVFTKSAPMVSGQFRALTDLGAFQIAAYATSSEVLPTDVVDGSTNVGDYEFRGYIFANGKLQFSQHWSLTGSLRRVTDLTFLRRYDISLDDRLRSMIDVQRVDQNSFLSIAGWATQTLVVDAPQGQVPIALPVIDYRYRMDDPLLGGKIELEGNTLGITRTDGQDTQRAFALAQWELRKVTGWGQVVTFTGMLRGDVYHSSQNDLTDTLTYRGNPGWESRGIALGAIDMTWPLVGSAFGGIQVITPHIQVVATPPVRNAEVPNEDSRAIDLDDTNLFALNRYPGYDRFEDGTRFTYGVDYQLTLPNWRINATVGQSYSFSPDPTIAPDGTGLSHNLSDIVGRVEVQFGDIIQFTERFRIDEKSGAFRKNEFNATIGTHQTYFEVGYTNLSRDIQELEDLPDRSELRAAGRVAFLKYWSIFGSGVVNLTSKQADPINGSDGFQPLRTRLGLAYTDDCIELGFTWRRDYVALADAKLGNTFLFHIALKNLGTH